MDEKSTIVASAAKEMDQMLKGVMPDTWMGHARLAADERDLSPDDKRKALDYTEQLVEENDYPSEQALDAVVGEMNIE